VESGDSGDFDDPFHAELLAQYLQDVDDSDDGADDIDWGDAAFAALHLRS
jgi:hypothetical protein